MKISICLPVIRRLDFLERAICSILLQDFQDWELIVKDGCPDEPVISSSRIKKFFELIGNSRLRYVVGRDRGIFYAFNEAIKLSTGDVIYCMCSDDLLVPGALNAVNEAFSTERFNRLFWVYGKTISADRSGKKLGVDGAPTKFDDLLLGNKIGLPAVFWSRGIISLTGGFDFRFRYSADYDLYLRCWRRREPTFISQELGIFCHHELQASRVNEIKLEREVSQIKIRHQFFGDVINSANNTLMATRAYDGCVPIEEAR